MGTSKHRKTRPGEAPRDDLEDDPGIGMSRGIYLSFSTSPSTVLSPLIGMGSPFPATNPEGGVDPNQIGRRNK